MHVTAGRIDWVLAVNLVILVVAYALQTLGRRRDQRRWTRVARENAALRVVLRELGVHVDLTQTPESIDVVAQWRTGAAIDWTVPRPGEVRH